MRRRRFAASVLLIAWHASVFGRGVTPYLPLNLEPEMEDQIERVLILAGKPVMSRPIAAATVLDALPKACEVDEQLCQRVARYIARFTHNYGVTHASAELAAKRGDPVVLPNRYGMNNDSSFDLSAQAYWQPSDYLLVNGGANLYQGKTDFTGSMISVGFSYAQLDIGYRPHWLSPMTDSSMLISTEAPTMPSVTLSNYEPITSLGLHYQLFEARMSESNHILFQGSYKTGRPDLAGIQLGIEPNGSGWSFAVNRLLQYGGGGRPSSLSDLLKGFFNPSKYDNTNPNLTIDQQFGNQQAAYTSSYLYSGKIPFSVYVEYAGEDTSKGGAYLLGNSALSMGIHFPRLWQRFDFTYEISEWQNLWYVHNVYQDGMTNYLKVIGHWFGDERVFNDGVGGRSQMARVGWDATFGGQVELRYRTLQNQSYGVYAYKRFHEWSLGYSRPWQGTVVGGELDAGRDVFGGNFTRLAAFIRYDDSGAALSSRMMEALSATTRGDSRSELFVDAGVNSYRLRVNLTEESGRNTLPRKTGYHVAVGARTAVSEHNDLGTRIDIENIESHSLVGIRLIDYRYRLNFPVAVGAFVGAARYSLETPAYGLYFGAGLQWRNVLPGWDIGAEVRYDQSIARDHVLPADPQGGRPDSFYDVLHTTVAISRHF